MGRRCILDPPPPRGRGMPAAVRRPAVVRRPACHSRRFKGERPIGAATGQQSQPPRPCANPPPPPNGIIRIKAPSHVTADGDNEVDRPASVGLHMHPLYPSRTTPHQGAPVLRTPQPPRKRPRVYPSSPTPEFCLTTQHLLWVGGLTPPPPPLLSDWANFSPGLQPIRNFLWRIQRKSV